MSLRTPRTKASRLERRQILTDAPIIWEELSKAMTEEVEEWEDSNGLCPGLLQVHDDTRLDPPSFTLSTADGSVRVTYHRKTPKITYEVARQGKKAKIANGILTFRRQSGETWMCDEKHAVLDLPDVIKQLLDYLI
jgi:hypothetical protein